MTDKLTLQQVQAFGNYLLSDQRKNDYKQSVINRNLPPEFISAMLKTCTISDVLNWQSHNKASEAKQRQPEPASL